MNLQFLTRGLSTVTSGYQSAVAGVAPVALRAGTRVNSLARRAWRYRATPAGRALAFAYGLSRRLPWRRRSLLARLAVPLGVGTGALVVGASAVYLFSGERGRARRTRLADVFTSGWRWATELVRSDARVMSVTSEDVAPATRANESVAAEAAPPPSSTPTVATKKSTKPRASAGSSSTTPTKSGNRGHANGRAHSHGPKAS